MDSCFKSFLCYALKYVVWTKKIRIKFIETYNAEVCFRDHTISWFLSREIIELEKNMEDIIRLTGKFDLIFLVKKNLFHSYV
jgi:hypothetical protein